MFNTTFEEDQIIIAALSLAARHGLHDAEESLAIFLPASQQGGKHGITLSLFHQIMILGVLQAARNAGLAGAADAADRFKRAKDAVGESLVPLADSKSQFARLLG